MEADWHKKMSDAEKSRMRRATLLGKASICDAIAKFNKRALKPHEIAHHRAAGVLPPGIDNPTEAAQYWRGLAGDCQ